MIVTKPENYHHDIVQDGTAPDLVGQGNEETNGSGFGQDPENGNLEQDYDYSGHDQEAGPESDHPDKDNSIDSLGNVYDIDHNNNIGQNSIESEPGHYNDPSDSESVNDDHADYSGDGSGLNQGSMTGSEEGSEDPEVKNAWHSDVKTPGPKESGTSEEQSKDVDADDHDEISEPSDDGDSSIEDLIVVPETNGSGDELEAEQEDDVYKGAMLQNSLLQLRT